ncbi:MAG: M23 family metallopeptidase [Duncaniella sp.]|nr:M23 family metallopeptidase [Duncaniella sp.]
MTTRIALLLSLILLSASRASCQSREADVLSHVNENDSATHAVAATSITDVLSFVVNTVDADSLKQEIDDAPHQHPAGHRDAPVGLEALSVIHDAYSDHSYYSSGTWARDQYIIYPAAMTPPVTGINFDIPRPLIITSPYGYREKYDRMHYGMDISLCVGDTITNPMKGTVSQVKNDPRGYGHYLIVVHDNGLETRYAHLSKSLVSPGQRIEQGEPIALSGNSGNSTGPHLHLEVRYRGLPLDPRAVFVF